MPVRAQLKTCIDDWAARPETRVLELRQFYDVVVNGVRHSRAAWSYEAPRPSLQQVAGRFGFWEDVQVV